MKTFELEFDPKEHTYKIDGIYVPGCTTVTSIFPKGGLVWWAAGEACTELGWLNPKKNGKDFCLKIAEAKLAEIKAMGVTEYMSLLDKAYRAHNVRKMESADWGTRVHDYCERFIKEGTLPPATEPKEVLNSFNKFLKWKEENEVKWLHSEVVVGSKKYMYAGKFDAVALVNGVVTMIDFKTSNGIYQEYHYQIAGYRNAYDEMEKAPKIGQHMILWIPKSGEEFKPFIVPTPYESDRQVFLAALELYKCLENSKRMMKELVEA